MNQDYCREWITVRIARSICENGTLGSPYLLSGLSRVITRLPREAADTGVVEGAAFLIEVGRTLFVSRSPTNDYRALKSKENTSTGSSSDVFGLCGRAISRAVFRRNWLAADALFELASHHAATFSSPYVRQMVLGLKERFLILPQNGLGVRTDGRPNDLLWGLNQAEQLFCQGNYAAARAAADTIVDRYPKFGWGRALLLRILFAQGDFQQARTVLMACGVGSLPAVEELAWNILLPDSEGEGQERMQMSVSSSLALSQFTLPLYFDGLSFLLRGDAQRGLSALRASFRSGDPYSLMLMHDPVVRFALQVSALGDDSAERSKSGTHALRCPTSPM